MSITEKTALIEGLRNSPLILTEFFRGIPDDLRKIRRIPDKWCIHEHACHLSQTEEMIGKRFLRFQTEEHPVFEPYLPGKTVETATLIELDFQEELDRFTSRRKELVNLLESFGQEVWKKTAKHPEYITYTPLILMRHTLMHDHFHMYRMEELWLTKPEFL